MQNRIIGIIAPKGSGKTFKVAEMIRSGEFARTVVFDMLCETAYLTCCDEIIMGRPKEFAEKICVPNTRIAYRPIIFQMQEGEEYCPEFETIVKLCYLKGDTTLVVDEAHQLCSAHMCPDALLSAIRLGRHRKLNIIYITQSWSAVARPLTANTDEFWFYKIIEPSDLDGIRKRCGQDVANKVASLRRLDYDANNKVIPGEIYHWSSFEGVKDGETEL